MGKWGAAANAQTVERQSVLQWGKETCLSALRSPSIYSGKQLRRRHLEGRTRRRLRQRCQHSKRHPSTRVELRRTTHPNSDTPAATPTTGCSGHLRRLRKAPRPVHRVDEGPGRFRQNYDSVREPKQSGHFAKPHSRPARGATRRHRIQEPMQRRCHHGERRAGSTPQQGLSNRGMQHSARISRMGNAALLDTTPHPPHSRHQRIGPACLADRAAWPKRHFQRSQAAELLIARLRQLMTCRSEHPRYAVQARARDMRECRWHIGHPSSAPG